MICNGDDMMENYNKEIANVFERVFYLEGISADGNDVLLAGRHVDDYLLVGLLSRLINDGVVDIGISNKISSTDFDYLQRLLHIKEREENVST